MKNVKRPIGAIAASVLLGLSLTACGGDGGGDDIDVADAPKDADKAEFCDAVNAMDIEEDELTEDSFEEFQDKLVEIAEIGTPEEITGDARKGFELLVETMSEMSFDEAKEFEDSESTEFPDMSSEESAMVFTFFMETGELCME